MTLTFTKLYRLYPAWLVFWRDGRSIVRPCRWNATECDGLKWPFPTWRCIARPFDWERDA